MRAAPPDKALGVLTVSYITLLLLMDKALKVLALLQGAVECEATYKNRQNEYELRDGSLRLHLELVQPSQVLMPDGAQMTPGTTPGRRAAPKAGSSSLRIENKR